MDPGRSSILRNHIPDGHFPNKPGETWVLKYFDRRPRRIVCLRHGNCSRVAGNMDYFAVGEPFQQFRNMTDIDRKLNTRPVTTAEPRNFFDKNPSNRSQASV